MREKFGWGGLTSHQKPGGLDKAKVWIAAAVLTTRKSARVEIMGEALAMRMD